MARTRIVTHQYRVGVLNDARLVEAPSPLSAAAFYGLQTRNHIASPAAVYEEDGRSWKGEAAWLRWSFGEEPTAEQLELLREQLPFCRFVNRVALRAA